LITTTYYTIRCIHRSILSSHITSRTISIYNVTRIPGGIRGHKDIFIPYNLIHTFWYTIMSQFNIIKDQEQSITSSEYTNIITSSSEDILRQLLELNPYVNLGRELTIARLHHLIMKLSPDIRSIHRSLREVGNISPTCEFNDSKITIGLGRGGECKFIYDEIVDSVGLSSLTIEALRTCTDCIDPEDEYDTGIDMMDITLNNLSVNEHDLELIWHLSSLSPTQVYDRESKRLTDNGILALSLKDLSQNVETIEKIRSYPGAIDRVLSHCKEMKNVLANVSRKHWQSSEIMYRLPHLWTNRIRIDRDYHRIQIEYRSDIHVQMMLNFTNRAIPSSEIASIDRGESWDRTYVTINLKDSYTWGRTIVDELNILRNLPLVSSLTIN